MHTSFLLAGPDGNRWRSTSSQANQTLRVSGLRFCHTQVHPVLPNFPVWPDSFRSCPGVQVQAGMGVCVRTKQIAAQRIGMHFHTHGCPILPVGPGVQACTFAPSVAQAARVRLLPTSTVVTDVSRVHGSSPGVHSRVICMRLCIRQMSRNRGMREARHP